MSGVVIYEKQSFGKSCQKSCEFHRAPFNA
jgi:hypothetical protein